jgi:CheY-like chemotaxis protein
MVLDLKLPEVGGLEVLKRIKTDPNLKKMPVAMLTSSGEEEDLTRSYNSGANAYVVKSVGFHDFVEAVKELGLFWVVVNQPPPGSIGLAY